MLYQDYAVQYNLDIRAMTKNIHQSDKQQQ